MESENETVAEIVKELRDDANTVADDSHDDDCWTNLKAMEIYYSLANRFEAAHRREVAELSGALKKAYDTLYSISCSRYGKGLTCTDDIHEVVTMARECSDELYANENLRKALEGANDEENNS